MKISTKDLVLFALFAALTAICSQLSIPLPFTPVPLNLATLSVFLSGSLLGAKGGVISQSIYVLMGIIGLPVFSKFGSGLGILTGPTGGYILGYILAALLVGLMIKNTRGQFWLSFLAMSVGLLACYTLGTAWFMLSLHKTLWQSLIACVFPFLIGDAIKIIAAVFLTKRLKKII